MWGKIYNLGSIKDSALKMASQIKNNYIFKEEGNNSIEDDEKILEKFYYRLKRKILSEDFNINLACKYKDIKLHKKIICQKSEKDFESEKEKNLKKKLTTLKSEFSELEKKVENFEKMKKDKKLNEENLLKYSQEMAKKLNDLVSKNNNLETRLKQKGNNLKNKEKEFLVIKKKNEDFEKTIDKKNQIIVELQMNMEIKKKEIYSEISKTKDNLNLKQSEFKKEISDYKENLLKKEKLIKSEKKKFEDLQNLLKIQKTENTENAKKIENFETKIEKLENNLSDFSSIKIELQKNEENNINLTQTIENLQRIIDSNYDIVEDLKKKYEKKIKEILNEKIKLEEEIILSKEKENENLLDLDFVENLKEDINVKKKQILDLEKKLKKKNDEIIFFENEKKQNEVKNKNFIDKKFIGSFLMNYLDVDNSEMVKFGVLETLASLLDFTESERARIGLEKMKLQKIYEAKEEVKNDKSIKNIFIDFLQK